MLACAQKLVCIRMIHLQISISELGCFLFINLRPEPNRVILPRVFSVAKDEVLFQVGRKTARWWCTTVFLRQHPQVVRSTAAAKTNIQDPQSFGFLGEVANFCASAGIRWKVFRKG